MIDVSSDHLGGDGRRTGSTGWHRWWSPWLGMQLYAALRVTGAPSVSIDVFTGTEGVVQPATANPPSAGQAG